MPFTARVRTYSQSALIAGLLGAVAACGGSSSAPAEPTSPATTEPAEIEEDETEPVAEPVVTATNRVEMGEQTMAMLMELTEVQAANKGDCAATTSGFRDTLKRYEESLAAGKKMEENPEDRQWFEETYSYKINNQVMLMRDHLGDCMAEPDFQEVMATLN